MLWALGILGAVAVVLVLVSAGAAFCPVCTGLVFAVVAGSKYIGLDLSITSVLVGGLGLNLGMLTYRLLRNRIGLPRWLGFVPVVVMWTLTVAAVRMTLLAGSYTLIEPVQYLYDPVMGTTYGQVEAPWWQLLLTNVVHMGAVVGAVGSLLAYGVHYRIKGVRGRVLFPFQVVVFNGAVLVLAGLGFYAVLNWFAG